MQDLKAEPGHAVVVVHGFAVPRLMTAPLARRLAQLGYPTVNLAYPSLLPAVQQVSDRLHRQICELARRADIHRIHLVSHSMGGILIRVVLQDTDLHPAIGRIVMLAPPNAGSRVATALAGSLGRWLRPLSDLSHRPESYVNRLPLSLPGLEVGVIAAAADHLVDALSTHLQGQADHLTVPGMHSSIVFSRGVAEQTAHFLKFGRFARTKPKPGHPS